MDKDVEITCVCERVKVTATIHVYHFVVIKLSFQNASVSGDYLASIFT